MNQTVDGVSRLHVILNDKLNRTFITYTIAGVVYIERFFPLNIQGNPDALYKYLQQVCVCKNLHSYLIY